MEGFKLCPNGHYFQFDLEECPYCPQNKQKSEKVGPDKSRLDNGKDMADDKTRISGAAKEKSSLDKTVIIRNDYEKDPDKVQNFDEDRKIAGWLISFTIDPNGKDFRLYEGRNTIGSESECDIVIKDDEAVSGKHLTILYRLGSFLFKDELSTNGTFVNDEFAEEGNLCDGDLIRTGKTIFRFRMV